MGLRNLAVLGLSLVLCLSSGCATRKLSLAQCAGLGAAAGAGAGGGAATAADTNDWIGAGVAIGAVVGAATGWLICKAIPEEVAAVPEPQAVTPPAPPPPRARVVLRGVNFDFDSAVPMEGSQSVLDVAAETLLANPDVRVRVEGFTDSVGPAEYNLGLSKRRAEAVRDMLIKAGVSADRLEVAAYGEDQPLATNETVEGRRINRRVQLVTPE
jgi:OOP family OmpA-OmpF porin